MRSKKELRSGEFRDDLRPLQKLLDKHKIPYIVRVHPVVMAEPQVERLIGYYPTGRFQIIIDKGISCVRGMVSFGEYEIMSIRGDKRFPDPERFTTARAVIEAVKATIA